MHLFNCEIIVDLNWFENYVIVATNLADQATTFSIPDTKLYVDVVTLSTQDQAKLLEQFKCAFKRTINWNRYQRKVSRKRTNWYLDFLIDPRFRGVNKLFVLPFKNEAQKTSYKRYYLPAREIKKYYVMVDRQNFFDQPVRNYLFTYDNI